MSLVDYGELRLSDLQDAYDVRELSKGAWLAVHIDGILVKFAICRFVSLSEDGEVLVEKAIRGSGYTGNLRELRHMWFGSDGYIHYPDLESIAEANKHLSEWFDL